MQTIINELYKTNLKFRTTNTGIIEILNQHFIPIAAIFPIIEDTTEDIPNVNHLVTDYLIAKGELENNID